MRRGGIDIDIPIETAVNGDSSVDVSAVVWQVIGEAFENLITSPIKALKKRYQKNKSDTKCVAYEKAPHRGAFS